jgi:cytochrome c biogenesis protein CcmG/thiol:disulfide interchange protein DsbE
MMSARRVLATGLLPALAFLIGPAGVMPGRAESPAASPARVGTAGTPAVPFELTTLDGQPLRLETFRGQPLVLNFFASWCDPCREEMPLFNALESEARERGYRILGVAVQDRRAAVAEYAREAGVVFPIALDLNSRVQRAYWVYGPPTTFFIDAEGVIRDKVVGPLSAERAREALARVGIRR